MIICPQCQNEFEDRIRRVRKFCSKACARKYNGNSTETREKLRNIMLEKVKNKTHLGWKSRKGKKPSYPEQFFMEVLKNNGIQYEYELPCGKYFIDFAIKSANIALEIDGKQHDYEDRKIKDLEKDKYLVDNGWKVYRIKWKSINNESGKIYIKEQIDKLLQFIQV
jgi:very-short-patch-repair endonuclease